MRAGNGDALMYGLPARCLHTTAAVKVQHQFIFHKTKQGYDSGMEVKAVL